MYIKHVKQLLVYIAVALALVAGASVIMHAQQSSPPADTSISTLTLRVAEGDHFNSYIRILYFLKLAKPPQMAFWIEDTSGRFVATIYVTRRTAVQDWRVMPFQDEIVARPSSLPAWTHRHVRAGIHEIDTCSHCHDRIRSADKSTDGDPILDAFTGATPTEGFTKQWTVPTDIEPGEYIIWAELNHSLDYNDTYCENLPPGDPNENDASGQPSVLYNGRLNIGIEPASCTLSLVGHGHPAGINGRIYPLDDTITTARDIVDTITVHSFPR